ncbi:ankyrin repeat domain-containing protein [Nocardioides cavernae]|uniref:ankyrin repeat domain-containing protein n=1 Tax=Nocardioides TaxID=1839 RepID=UPI000AD2A621|nr:MULTISPECIES: ankyrin repeat domain-containing protein [Nocardioides]MCK9822620.1 ankyrin repeat domain-containing protein [Nocardioides cavernae]
MRHTSPAVRLAGAVAVLGTVGCSAEPLEADRTAPASASPSSSASPHPTKDSVPEPSGEPTADPTADPALDAALIEAAWAGDVDRARRLVRRGADVNAQDGTRQSAFLIATSEGPVELLDLTLRHGADVGAHDGFDGTGLIRAAERGLADVVGRLVQTRIELDHVNDLGWTALHEAVVLGDGAGTARATVRVLLAAGVDTTIRSGRDGLTAEQHAREMGYADLARLLAGAGRPVGDPDAALQQAARRGDADAAALAIRAGARLEARDARRRTPLLLAVTEDRLAVAQLLVRLGADPDAVDDQQDTPWLVTGVTGSVPMARLLVTARPDLTLRNRFGGISIIPASERGHVDYVRWVVAHTDIDVDHVNDLGWTALLEAVVLGRGTEPWQRIVRILLDAGADPAIPDGDGVTALEHARSRGFEEIAALFSR